MIANERSTDATARTLTTIYRIEKSKNEFLTEIDEFVECKLLGGG